MTHEAFETKYAMTAQRAAYIVSHFLRHLLSDEEWQELNDWATAGHDNQVLFEKLIEPDRFEKAPPSWWYATGVGELEQKILKALLKDDIAKQPVYKLMWFRIAGAAVIIGGIVIAAVQVFWPRKDWTTISASIATITTPGGKQIRSTRIGNTPQQLAGGGVISQNEGVLKYDFNGKRARPDRYYVVQVPEPFLYRMILQDGSRLWFAANTVVRFPESFDSSQRIIEVRGHIYIEIAEDKRPFTVRFSNGEMTSRNGHFDLSNFQGQLTAIVMAKGAAYLKRDYVPVMQIKGGFRTVLDQPNKARQDRVDVESFTGWRHGIVDGMKGIFNRAKKGDYLRIYDSIYNNDSIK
jgi:hypothetical protein